MVYLQVFICRKWVIFPCINADSWEKDVQLHFVSGTKFYNKNVCHIVWVYQAWRLSIGCRAELNRTPLKSKILFSIYNFMNHTISSKNTLVYDIYIKSRETNPWVKKVKNLLNGLGHSYLINNINSITKIQHYVMTKAESDFFFFLYQNQNIFFSNIGNQNILTHIVDILEKGEFLRITYVCILSLQTLIMYSLFYYI
jgi:hypothetical protein